MELEDLKSKWHSVKPHIDQHLNDEIIRQSISKGIDIKTRILRRSLYSQILVFVCILLMGTSRIWAPLKLPYWWIGLFCTLFFFTILYSIKERLIIKKIDFGKDSNSKIMNTVISIKRHYRNMELVSCIAVFLLLLWMSLSPSIINTWRMYYIWGLISLGFILEYFWYKSNVKLFNKLINL